MPSLWPHLPTRDSVYDPTRTATDIALLAGSPHACPFGTGQTEPDPSALDDGVALVLYQAGIPADTLRLVKDGTRIRLDF